MVHCRHVVELILDYLEGNLDPEERQAFEAHIADCKNCWRFLCSYQETISLGRELRVEDVPPDVRERLETFVRSRIQRPLPPSKRPTPVGRQDRCSTLPPPVSSPASEGRATEAR
jgi:anti-sigma factor RsiW